MDRKILTKAILFMFIGVLAFTPSARAVSNQFNQDQGVLFYGLDVGECSQTNAVQGQVSSADLKNVPDPWRSLMLQVAPEYPETDPSTVAASLFVENRGWPDYNKDWGTSSAGAKGPWQFIDSSWASMGKDGDGDGIKDVNNPKDAVHGAFVHHSGSAGKPLIQGFSGDLQDGLSLKFKRDRQNLLSFMASYNGSGAPDNTALKDFPRGENADYVIMSYYAIGSSFTIQWDTTTGETKPISGDVQGTSPVADESGVTSCSEAGQESGTGMVNAEGFSMPLGLAKNRINLPCNSNTCHHDGTYAADLMAPEGTDVYAIEDGNVTFKDKYDGITGCYSAQFYGKSGWVYWYGHLKNANMSKERYKAGEKIAEVGPGADPACGRGSAHLHIDRGDPKGHTGGEDCCRSQTIIPLLNQLWEEMPE